MSNPQFTFDTFIKADSNLFALAACKAVAKNPFSYNPLWLYGKVGCGKSHLLSAVYNELVKNTDISTLFLRTKDAVDLLIDYIHGEKSDWLCALNCDVLIMDNLEYLLGRPTILQEFTNLILKKVSNGQSVIFATDCAPKHIEYLDNALKENTESSLVADIAPAGTDLRINYIKEYMSKYPFDIDDDALYYIIENCKSITVLKGVLTTAGFYSKRFDKRIDLDWLLKRGN